MRAFWLFFLLCPAIAQASFFEGVGTFFKSFFFKTKKNNYVCNQTSDNEFIQIIQHQLKDLPHTNDTLLWNIVFQKEVEIENDPTISNEERIDEIYKLWSTEMEQNFSKNSTEFKNEMEFVVSAIKIVNNFIDCFNLETDGSVEALLFSTGLETNFTSGTDKAKNELLQKRLIQAKAKTAKVVDPLSSYYRCPGQVNTSEESLLDLIMSKISYYTSLENITSSSKREILHQKLELLNSGLNMVDKNLNMNAIWEQEKTPADIAEKELKLLNSMLSLAKKFTSCHKLANIAETARILFSSAFDDYYRKADRKVKRRFLWKNVQLAKKKINLEEIEERLTHWKADLVCSNITDEKQISAIENINDLFIHTSGIVDGSKKFIYLEKFALAERFRKAEIDQQEFFSQMAKYWTKWNSDAPAFRLGYDAIFIIRLTEISEKLGKCFKKDPVYVASKYFGLAFDYLFRRSQESSRRILIENIVETIRGKNNSP